VRHLTHAAVQLLDLPDDYIIFTPSSPPTFYNKIALMLLTILIIWIWNCRARTNCSR